jgi:hypothetical protein
MARYKYPSTPHMPFSPGVGRKDRVLRSLAHFQGREVVITEKRNGENSSLSPPWSPTYRFRLATCSPPRALNMLLGHGLSHSRALVGQQRLAPQRLDSGVWCPRLDGFSRRLRIRRAGHPTRLLPNSKFERVDALSLAVADDDMEVHSR